MSRRIPIFPLPGVVLLPGTLLPLHVFEPRYRAMVADALAGDRTIGMTMWKAGGGGERGEPRIHEVGGAGEIVESERLEDGRYNIVLEGRFRFRVLDEAPPDPYRVARVVEIPSQPLDEEDRERVVTAAAGAFGPLARAAGLPP